MFFDFLGRSGRKILLHKDIGISRNISVKINKPLFPKKKPEPRLNWSPISKIYFSAEHPRLECMRVPGGPRGESSSGPKQNDKHPKHLPFNKIPPGHGGTSGT